MTEDDCDHMQEDVNEVTAWCAVNGFKLNTKKCVCMSFTLKKNIIKKEFQVNGSVLKRVFNFFLIIFCRKMLIYLFSL